MANILQDVQTYNRSDLALLQNECCLLSIANKKFNNFQDITGNLGDTVTFDKPPRFRAQDGLVVTNFGPTEQLKESLTVDKAKHVPYAFTGQEFIFNVERYMEEFGDAAIGELGAVIEIDLGLVFEEAPFRFYGNGISAINSFGQLADALTRFRNFGAPKTDVNGILPDTAIPAIVDTGANQFAPKRNDELVMDWELGRFSKCDWYESNLLPLHTSGTLGNDQTVLTVTSTTKNAAGQITAITFSGAGTDADAVKQYDLFEFRDGVSGQPNVRFLTWIGHHPSASPVQFQATADAASSGGNVTISISPALDPVSTSANQNLNNDIAAGMQVLGTATHRRGAIIAGKPFYVAMPRLPDQRPFDTGTETDPETGVSLRMTTGAVFGQNQLGTIHDVIWGRKLVPEYAMALLFPA